MLHNNPIAGFSSEGFHGTSQRLLLMAPSTLFNLRGKEPLHLLSGILKDLILEDWDFRGF